MASNVKCGNFMNLNCRKKHSVNKRLENLINDDVDVLLLQEPATNRDNTVDFFRNYGTVYADEKCNKRPLAAIVVKRCFESQVEIIEDLTDRYCSTITYKCKINNMDRKILVSSIYVKGNYNLNGPNGLLVKVKKLIDYAYNKNLPFIISGDWNTHFELWDDHYDIGGRGEMLYDFMCDNNMTLLNDTSLYTYISDNCRTTSTIDLTFVNELALSFVVDWDVRYDLNIGSDHIPIVFKIDECKNDLVKRLNYKKIDVQLFRDKVKLKLSNKKYKCIYSYEDLNGFTGELQEIISSSIRESCPWTYIRNPKDKPWKNNLIDLLQKDLADSVLELKNAHDNGENIDTLKELRDKKEQSRLIYEKEVYAAKTGKFWEFASEINTFPVCARLLKVTENVPTYKYKPMRKEDGSFTDNYLDALKIISHHHFTDISVDDETINFEHFTASSSDRRRISRWLKNNDILKFMNEFLPNKTPGIDGITPKMLKLIGDLIVNDLKKIYKYCLCYGVTPKNWLTIKVIFIRKPGKSDYNIPSSYRPISLMCFLLKTLEKILVSVNLEIFNRVNKNQFAYVKNKNTVQAVQCLTNIINERLKKGKVTYALFSDINGAFDKTKFTKIKSSLSELNLPRVFQVWFNNILW